MGWKMPIVIKVATAIINPEKYTLIVIGFEFFFCRGAVFFIVLFYLSFYYLEESLLMFLNCFQMTSPL